MSIPFLVPNKRKVIFNCKCTIAGLSNLPYVSGLYYAKWRNVVAGVSGSTQRMTVKGHEVSWNSSFEFNVTMIIGKKDRILKPSELRITIKQAVIGNRQSEKIGSAVINLAELATGERIVKRTLLQETKLNSTLELIIEMTLIKGEENQYVVPSLTRSKTDLDFVYAAADTIDRTNKENTENSTSRFDKSDPTRLSIIGEGNDHLQVIDEIFASVGTSGEQQHQTQH